MSYQITKLNSRHHNIIKMILIGQYSQVQIARLVGMDPQSIGYIINSPVFQAELVRRRDTLVQHENNEIVNNLALADEQLKNASLGAVKVLDKLANESPDENVQLRAAESILKQAFGREDAKGGVTQIGQVIVLDPRSLDFLRQVRKESGLEHGKFVDSTIVGNGDDSTTNAVCGTVERVA